MRTFSAIVLGLASLLLPPGGRAQAIYKCTGGGQTTYQATPCPGGGAALPSSPNERRAPATMSSEAPGPDRPRQPPSSATRPPAPAGTAASRIRPEPTPYEVAYESGIKLFRARCATAGKIVRTAAKGVAGIRLETIPDRRLWAQRMTDRNWVFAGMPQEHVGDKFVESFLDFHFTDSDLAPDSPYKSGFTVRMKGFQYVDVAQPGGGYVRHRLAGGRPGQGLATEPPPHQVATRYSVRVEPIGTEEERAQWVAGSHVKVFDHETGQTVGEFRSFSFALPLEREGADLQDRRWSNRLSCPKHLDIQSAMTRVSLIGIVDP